LVTWQRPRPFARDLRESHKKAGFSVVLDNNPSSIFNQLSLCTLHTVYALLFTLLILLFCCQVTFCALVYFMWVFVLSQFPSHNSHETTSSVARLQNYRRPPPYRHYLYSSNQHLFPTHFKFCCDRKRAIAGDSAAYWIGKPPLGCKHQTTFP
jgi:hypothetical protein